MRFDRQDFRSQRVELDGNQYFDCTFYDCTLVFNAYYPVTFERCNFDQCDWVFEGNADIMLSFLTGLYHGLGKSGEDLVGVIFAGIRDRRFVNQPEPSHAVGS